MAVAPRQGASLAVRLKAYPDTNLFRSERESYVAQSGRHGAPPRVPETTGGESRFLTTGADSEWQIDKADSSPLKRIRNDKLAEHSSWPFIDIGFFAVSTSANNVGGRGLLRLQLRTGPPHTRLSGAANELCGKEELNRKER